MISIETRDITKPAQDPHVFSPGVSVDASVKVNFTSAVDAAWFEACLLRLKRGDGQLDQLHRGLLISALRGVASIDARDLRNDAPTEFTPEALAELRMGAS